MLRSSLVELSPDCRAGIHLEFGFYHYDANEVSPIGMIVETFVCMQAQDCDKST